MATETLCTESEAPGGSLAATADRGCHYVCNKEYLLARDATPLQSTRGRVN